MLNLGNKYIEIITKLLSAGNFSRLNYYYFVTVLRNKIKNMMMLFLCRSILSTGNAIDM